MGRSECQVQVKSKGSPATTGVLMPMSALLAATMAGYRLAAKSVIGGLERLGLAGQTDWELAALRLAKLPVPNVALLPPPEPEGAMWQPPRQKASTS